MISTQKGFIKIFAPNIVLLFFIKTQYIVIWAWCSWKMGFLGGNHSIYFISVQNDISKCLY